MFFNQNPVRPKWESYISIPRAKSMSDDTLFGKGAFLISRSVVENIHKYYIIMNSLYLTSLTALPKPCQHSWTKEKTTHK